MSSITYKTLYLITLFSVILLISSPRTLAQSISSSAPSVSKLKRDDDDDNDHDDGDDVGEVDCDYNGSVKDYLSCAKGKISTPMLIGAGVGVTLGVFLLAFLCIWLTRKKRRRVASAKENGGEEGNTDSSQNQHQGRADADTNIDIEAINKDLEKDPKSMYIKDIEDRDVKWNVVDDEKEQDGEFTIVTRNKSRSNNNINNTKFELLDPPKPRSIHNKDESTSSLPTNLDADSLKIHPTIRKGSRDNLYNSGDNQQRSLKHAPSTRRPRPTTNQYQAQSSINGSIHGEPITVQGSSSKDGNGNLRIPSHVQSRSGSPVQFLENRELEITNPNPLSRENSVYLKPSRPVSTQLPIPSEIHSKDGKRPSIVNLPKPTNRVSALPNTPPAYAMGPQPPPPSHAQGQGQKVQKQLPVRSSSYSQSKSVLPETHVETQSTPSKNTTSHKTRPSVDGRSGTFGPNVLKASLSGANLPDLDDDDDDDDDDEKVLENAQPASTSANVGSDKGSDTKASLSSTKTPLGESQPTTTTTTTDEPKSKPSVDATEGQAKLGESAKEKEKGTTSAHTLNEPKPETEQGVEEGSQKETKKSRREELRQTDLIPSYYVTKTPDRFDADEGEELPNPFDKAFQTQPQSQSQGKPATEKSEVVEVKEKKEKKKKKTSKARKGKKTQDGKQSSDSSSSPSSSK